MAHDPIARDATPRRLRRRRGWFVLALAGALAACGYEYAPELTDRSEFEIAKKRYAVDLPAGAAIQPLIGRGVTMEMTPGRRASPAISLSAPAREARPFDTRRALSPTIRISYHVMTAEAGSGGAAAVLEGRLMIREDAYDVACYIQGDDVTMYSAEWCLPVLTGIRPLSQTRRGFASTSPDRPE